VSRGLYAFASVMLILLGLYLAGLSRAVLVLEHLGSGIWKKLQPLMKRFMPVRNPLQAVLVGMIWGWLPCGLVYSVLLTALASGSALQGAFIMLAFGLGTLPNLLAIGLFWESVKGWVQSPQVRWRRVCWWRIRGVR
jgi:sulfite exporter TauE/SafE